MDDFPAAVEVRRSARRRRTVSAHVDGDRVVVMVPARFTAEQEREWVDRMVARLARQVRRRRPDDAALARRAAELSTRYLDGAARPASVAWVTNQGHRWGSCTPADRTIRLSDRLRGQPAWVVDYVLLHELTHLIVPGHGSDFWALVGRYPQAERARGYLEGYTAGLAATPDRADRSGADRSGVDEGASGCLDGPGDAPGGVTGEVGGQVVDGEPGDIQ